MARLWVTLRKSLAQPSDWVAALGTASSTCLACPVLTVFLKLIIESHFFPSTSTPCFYSHITSSLIHIFLARTGKAHRFQIRSLPGEIEHHGFPGPWASMSGPDSLIPRC